MEAGVTVLNNTILVFHPQEHMVNVEVIPRLLCGGLTIIESQRIATFRVRCARNGLEDVLGVVLEHLLGGLSQLVRVVLVLLVQFLVRRCTILGEGGRVHGVAVSGWVGSVLARSRGHNALVQATCFEPHAT